MIPDDFVHIVFAPVTIIAEPGYNRFSRPPNSTGTSESQGSTVSEKKIAETMIDETHPLDQQPARRVARHRVPSLPATP